LNKESLIAALHDPDQEVRWLAAAKLLNNDHALDAIPALQHLAGGETTGRWAAGQALATWGKVSAIPDLERAISIEADENTRIVPTGKSHRTF
jgi:HEAT repeat protein